MKNTGYLAYGHLSPGDRFRFILHFGTARQRVGETVYIKRRNGWFEDPQRLTMHRTGRLTAVQLETE